MQLRTGSISMPMIILAAWAVRLRGTIGVLLLVSVSFANDKMAAQVPSSLAAYPSDSKVLVQWARLANATDYTVEYKQSTASTWITFPNGVGTTPGVTVTGLTDGISYDFRVTATISGTATEASIPCTATPTAIYNNHLYNQILSTGQSLSVGWTGSPPLSITQPFSNVMLNADSSAFIPLVEPATNAQPNVETMSSGMANMLSYLTNSPSTQIKSIITLNGVGSTPYNGLKKGTVPYAKGINWMNDARDLSNAASIPYRVNAITCIHGEQDESNGTSASTYEGYLKQWQSDYEKDMKSITGQDDTIPMFICQMSSWQDYGHATPTTALGQLKAALDNPGKIYLVTPKYMLDYNRAAGGVHLTNYSYRRLGEYYGKVMKKVLIEKRPWLPLLPSSIKLKGSVITVVFNVPSPPLQFDTSAVMFKPNYGFEYIDKTMSASISKVAITGPQTVAITLNKIPTGTAKELAYAYTGIPDSVSGRNIPGSPKGNLCDSDTMSAFYRDNKVPSSMGTVLKNWCVTFCDTIDTTSAVVSVVKPGIPMAGNTCLNVCSNTISFLLASANNVSLEVFDASGKKIGTLLSGFQASGDYSFNLKSRFAAYNMLICKLTIGEVTTARKVMLGR